MSGLSYAIEKAIHARHYECWSDSIPKHPNLFVIGVPKAGSTSLFQWLDAHPSVHGSVEWELRYLMDQADPLSRRDGYHINGDAGYEKFFQKGIGEDGIKYLLDVSPQYYYQDTARSFIAGLPKKKIIIVLRKPSRRILSLYRYAYNNISMLPKQMDFAGFVEELRREDRSVLFRGKTMLQDAIKQTKYVNYLETWLEVIDRSDLKILMFEELVANPISIMRDVALFLGIDPTFYDHYSFDARNKSISVRSQKVHRLARRVNKGIPNFVRRIGAPVYHKLNASKKPSFSNDSEIATLAELDEYFIESEESLFLKFGVDRGPWQR